MGKSLMNADLSVGKKVMVTGFSFSGATDKPGVIKAFTVERGHEEWADADVEVEFERFGEIRTEHRSAWALEEL